MLDISNMTFEEFIEFGEKKTGHKTDGQVKVLLSIIFDNLKSGAWTEEDLCRVSDAMKENLNSKKARLIV